MRVIGGSRTSGVRARHARQHADVRVDSEMHDGRAPADNRDAARAGTDPCGSPCAANIRSRNCACRGSRARSGARAGVDVPAMPRSVQGLETVEWPARLELFTLPSGQRVAARRRAQPRGRARAASLPRAVASGTAGRSSSGSCATRMLTRSCASCSRSPRR